MTFRFYIFSLIFQSFVVSALILYPREAPAPIQSTLASMEVLEYRKFPAPDDWEKTLRLMNQLDDLQNRLDHLETHRIVNRKYRDPFAFEQAPASLSVDENPILKVEPKKTPKPVLIPKPVPVEEMAVAAPVQPRPTIRIKAQTEKKKPRIVKIDEQSFSLAGLNAKQAKILEIIAKIPDYPTEYIRGTRYVRVGEKRYRDDCSNVLRIAYDAIGIDLFSEHHLFPGANGVKLIRKKGDTSYASTSSTNAKVGDIIVFDNTFDRNGNGSFDDKDTHAGIVIAIDSDGTVALYNRVASGHRVYRMNLRHKSRIKFGRDGRRINNVLRRVKKSKRSKTPRLTGQLFANYVTVIAA